MKIESRADQHVRFGAFELNPRTRELYRNRSKLKLHGQPINLLEILLEHAGELVTREELRQRLWPANTFVDFEHILNNDIKRLREALGDDANAPHFIETLPRLGYRFIAPVTTIDVQLTDPAETPDRTQNDLSSADLPNNRLNIEPNIFPISTAKEISTASTPHHAAPADTFPPATPYDKRVIWRQWVFIAVAITLIITSAISYMRRPLPRLRITGEYLQITHDGFRKELAGTDGVRLYLTQYAELQSIAQVSISGGQIGRFAVALPEPKVFDVSADGSSLLVYSIDRFAQKIGLWSVSVPGGTLRHLADGEILSAAWSPDAESVVYSVDNAIYLAHSDGSQAHKISPFEDFVFDLAWSPDGGRIRFWRLADQKIWEMSPQGSGLRPVFPNWRPSSTQCCGHWTPDGRFFIFASWINRWGEFSIQAPLQLWAVDERRRLLRHANTEPFQLTSGPIRWSSLVPGKDGKTLFARGTILHGELTSYSTKTGQFQPFLGGISAQDVAFSRDGKSLVYVTFPEGVLWRANRDGTNPVQLTDPPLYAIGPVWSPDGTEILFGAADSNGSMKSYLVSAQGGVPRLLLPQDKGEQWAPDWSPDGRRILFQNSAVQILDLASHQISTVADSANMNAPRWSPDGRYIAAAFGLYYDLKVFDFKTNRWSLLQKGNAFPTWSRDSRSIYFPRLEGDHAGLYRVRISGGEAERVVDLRGFRPTGVYDGWAGLDPDGMPLFLRDKGTSEIYALNLETK